MIKIIIVLLIIIGLGGHFVPIKTYVSDPQPLISTSEQVKEDYRIISGNYHDYKKATQDILCTITCGNTVHKLYLW